MPTQTVIVPGEVEDRYIGVIHARDFQRYAVAVGDLNPIYFEDAAARQAGYRGIVAPPNFLTSVRNWGPGPFEGDLQRDGTEVENLPRELYGMRLMGGGHDLRFGRPVYPGDVVRARRRLIDFYTKTARFGELSFAVYEIVYFADNGDELVTCRETIIAAQ